MKIVESGVAYDKYLYPNPDNPFEHDLIRDDAPDWAKEAYEYDLKLYEDAYRLYGNQDSDDSAAEPHE